MVRIVRISCALLIHITFSSFCCCCCCILEGGGGGGVFASLDRETGSSHGRLLEQMESLGTKTMMRGPIVHQL